MMLSIVSYRGIQYTSWNQVINHGVQDSSALVVQQCTIDHIWFLSITRPRSTITCLHPYNIPIVQRGVCTRIIRKLPCVVNEIPCWERLRQPAVERERCGGVEQSDRATSTNRIRGKWTRHVALKLRSYLGQETERETHAMRRPRMPTSPRDHLEPSHV